MVVLKKYLFTGLCFLLLLVASRIAQADDIAFFYALDVDFRALKEVAGTIGKPTKVGERSIQILSLHKHKIYAIKMGSGAVQTASSAQALLGRFRCDRAFSVGPIGAISDKLKIGNWYDVSNVVAYQKGSWLPTGFLINDGASFKLDATRGRDLLLPEIFRQAPPVTVASGEIFVSSSSYREQLHKATGADAVDMNLFGLISVCADYHLPLLNWRIVSDRADDNATDDFRKFVEKYDGAGGKALAEIIRNLPPNPNSPESYPALQKLLEPNAKPNK